MAPAVDRLLTIEYGDPMTTGIRLGGPSERLIFNWNLQEGVEENELEVTFLVAKTVSGELATEIAVITAALNEPRRRIRILVDEGAGDVTWYDFDPATNSGFDQDPQLTPEESVLNTAHSRLYTWKCTVRLPASQSGQSGRRLTSGFDVRFASSRRQTVTFNGTYTSVAGLEARAQFGIEFSTYATGILDTLLGSANYEPVEDPTTEENDSRKELTFSSVYREILVNQISGTLNDPEVVDPIITLDRRESSPGNSVLDGVAASNPIEVGVTYSAAIDKTITQELFDKVITDILPRLNEHVREAFNASNVALIEFGPKLDTTENTVDISATYVVYDAGDLLSATQTTTDELSPPETLVPAWVKGQPLAHFGFAAPVAKTRTVTTITQRLQAGITSSDGGGGGGGAGIFGFGGVAGNLGAFQGRLGAIAGVGAGGNGFGFGARGIQINPPAGGAGGAGGLVVGGGGGGAGAIRMSDQGTREIQTPRRFGLRGQTSDVVERTFETRVQFVTAPPGPGQGPGPAVTRARAPGP